MNFYGRIRKPDPDPDNLIGSHKIGSSGSATLPSTDRTRQDSTGKKIHEPRVVFKMTNNFFFKKKTCVLPTLLFVPFLIVGATAAESLPTGPTVVNLTRRCEPGENEG